ncbi:flagellar biosynthetic protein FliO [Colwellia psychrerythraea]|uniref:Flagellar protein n=1 Tax=Colwellia psychrerythraea TaxID=28229 RepID=A0A1Y5DYJ2_COLPS|nr:flagellar biosynthetic protein FliO [Colwellia psychrerythraea]
MILKTIRILLAFSCCLLSLMVLAQENVSENDLIKKVVTDQGVDQQSVDQEAITQQGLVQQVPESQINNNNTPEVGKHVMANMDAGSMILSLLMVLALIIICALVLKRFNFTQQSVSQLKVVTSLSLGAKERVVVIQAGEQQLLLGVTAQQVTLIERLDEPLATQTLKAAELPKNLLSFLSAKKL